jgi:hypothetical protein
VSENTVNPDGTRDDFQPWSWSNVVAAESNIKIGTKTVTALAQFYYTQNPTAADNFVSSSFRLFDRTYLLGLRFPYSDALLISASALYETHTQGWFWSAGFESSLTDTLKWALTWRDFSAERQGLLKTFDRNDHVTLDLNYYF